MNFFCREIYALNPDLCYVLPERTKFMPYSHVFVNKIEPTYIQLNQEKLRIGHAPTHRKVKGTSFVLDAVNKLIMEGYNLELVLIEGKSHKDAMQIYKEIDILVDQLFAGWYGGVAVEVMAFGKPVIVYLREDDLKFIPCQMREELPFIQANPDNIFQVIKEVTIMPRSALLEIAHQSRKFVEKWHNPIEIAKMVLNDYQQA
jgi:hypothetical protein